MVALELQEALTKLGYKVQDPIGRGEDVLDVFRERKPDLVLMDIRLQGKVDGVQAARQIRSLSNTPIVFLSAHFDSATLSSAARSQPEGYLVKPFREQDLEANIRVALFKRSVPVLLTSLIDKFSILLEALPLPAILFSPQGLILHANPGASHLVGSGGEQMLQEMMVGFPGGAFPAEIKVKLKDRNEVNVDVFIQVEALRDQDLWLFGYLATLDTISGHEKSHLRTSSSQVNQTLRQHLPEDDVYAPLLRSNGFWCPSASGCGDHYGLTALADNRFLVYSLDVMGHGSLAALLAYAIVSDLVGLARQWEGKGDQPWSPASLLQALNTKYYHRNDASQFFTLSLAVLDIEKRQVRMVRGGHPPALITSSDGTTRFVSCPGAALGTFPFIHLEETVESLRPGDRLWFFTDGVFECFTDTKTELDFEALARTFEGYVDLPIKKAVEEIERIYRASWTNGRDDACLLAIEIPDPLLTQPGASFKVPS